MKKWPILLGLMSATLFGKEVERAIILDIGGLFSKEGPPIVVKVSQNSLSLGTDTLEKVIVLSRNLPSLNALQKKMLNAKLDALREQINYLDIDFQ